jgi:cobalt-zinc-cadmium efflux system outer membrane protein
MSLRTPGTLAVLLVAFASWARADEPTEISLDDALALARARAPETGAARLRVDEAHARLVGASVLLRENPSVGFGLGPRVTGPSAVAADAEVSQAIELGGRRSARIEGARAGVEGAAAAADEASRRVLREVGTAFYRAVHAQERLKLAQRAEDLAQATLRIAERRHLAGDVPVLHVNIARGTLARSRSEHKAMQAVLAATLGEMRVLLGLEPNTPLGLKGDLGDRARAERTASQLGQPGDRPDIRVGAAQLREASAGLRLGTALGWPEIAFGVKYSQEEEGASAVLGTVKLTLPVFERGQGVRAEARARVRRLRFELDATRRRVHMEGDTALMVYHMRVDALAELAATAPMQEQNEALARRSYEMGELGLADLLLVRREVLETQVEFLGRQLDAAIAGIELEAATGALK